MTTTPLKPVFYQKIVPLNKQQHKDLYIEPVEGFGFAKHTNSLYIAAVEFLQAAREYPIVFGQDAKQTIFPVVLLGLQQNQNLYVDEKDRWQARYIPAYARRYPFILAAPEGATPDQFTVCIDEGFPGFNTAKEGQALFDKKGKETKVLQQALDFLKDYQNHVQLTTAFCKNLGALGLLEPMQANVEMRSGKKFALAGFQCVSRAKLKALEGKKLQALLKSDELELIFMHLVSLGNVRNLMEKLEA